MPITVQDVGEQLTWHWHAQARPRLAGLDDAEYLWEPVVGAWTMRRSADGTCAPDWEWPTPDPTPVTTIAWRLCHVWMTLVQRADFHFGSRTMGLQQLTWPTSAAEALAAVDAAFTTWTEAVSGLSTTDADRFSDGPPGTLDGQFPLWAVVLHVNREVIHHLAEIAVLRDLYGAGAGATS